MAKVRQTRGKRRVKKNIANTIYLFNLKKLQY